MSEQQGLHGVVDRSPAPDRAPPSASTPTSRALAVLLPLLVLGSAIGWLMRAEPPATVDGVELQRAGRIVNGAVVRGEDARAAIARHLERHERRVLVVGNSLAQANLDPEEVARQLGLRPGKVGVVAIPNSIASHWYAVLQNAVFGEGYRPELVIVVSSLQAMLMVEPYSDASRQSLLVHLRPSEPVLDRYVRRGHPWLERWGTRRLVWRQAALDALRDRAVGLFMGGNTEAAMGRLFRDDKLEQRPPASWSPGVDLLGEEEHLRAASAGLAVERSLLGELAALAEAYGADLLFVRSPSAPYTPADLRDVVDEGVAEAAAALLAARGHRLLDESQRRMPWRWFENYRHMSPEGATVFTQAIGDDLRAAWEQAKTPRGDTSDRAGEEPGGGPDGAAPTGEGPTGEGPTGGAPTTEGPAQAGSEGTGP